MEQTVTTTPDAQDIRDKSRKDLIGKWGTAAAVALIYSIVSLSANMIPYYIGSLLIGGPLALGLAFFALKIARGKQIDIADIFEGFKNFVPAMIAYVLVALASGIGFILLIVPGIIVACGLSQTFFILSDHPETKPVAALEQSWEMMKGHKMDYFVLGLSFIGWAILAVLTLFIGFFWLQPYMQVSFANFYDYINNRPQEELDSNITDHLIEL